MLHPQDAHFRGEAVGPLRKTDRASQTDRRTRAGPASRSADSTRAPFKKPKRESLCGCGDQEGCLEAAAKSMSDTELMAESQPRLPGETPERDSHGSPAGPPHPETLCGGAVQGGAGFQHTAWHAALSPRRPRPGGGCSEARLTPALGPWGSPQGEVPRGKQDMSSPPPA